MAVLLHGVLKDAAGRNSTVGIAIRYDLDGSVIQPL